MILVVDTEGRSVQMGDPDNFRQLHAQVQGSGDLQAALAGLATVADDQGHLWVRVAGLRALGRPAGAADWHQHFDAMMGYARSKGWLDATGDSVRVHIERDAAAAG